MDLFSAQEVTKSYSNFKALSEVSISVPEGTIFWFTWTQRGRQNNTDPYH